MHILKKLYTIFDKELIFLQNNLMHKNANPIHNQIIFHLINKKSKKIRFLLVVLIGRILNDVSKNLLYAAMAVEIIHNATLIHDDIIDESDFRHNLKTAHKIWGNKISILIGDYLFMQALLCVTRTQNMLLIETVAESTRKIIDGEIVNFNKEIKVNDPQNYQDYMQWISSKTATLFALAARIPAILNQKSTNETEQWYKLGIKIGIGFQIIDDIMDYKNINQFGKEVGKDFFNGQITLPSLLCMQNATPDEMQFWQRIMEDKKFMDGDWKTCTRLLQKYEAIEKAIQMARDNIDEATEILNDINHKYSNKGEFIILIKDLLRELLIRIT